MSLSTTAGAVVRRVAAVVVASGLLFAAGCGEAPKPESSSAQSTTNGELDVSAYEDIIKSGAVADDSLVEANTWATSVRKAGVLKVGGTQTSTLFSLLSTSDQQVRGFDAGLASLLARYIIGKDGKTELTVVDSSTRESVLQNGTVNAVFATYSITDKRKEQIDFAGPYYTSRQAILVKKSNTDITGTGDLSGKKVGVQKGSTGPQVVAEVAPKASVQEFQTNDDITQALRQGRIDAYVVDETLLLGNVAKNPNDFKIVGEPFGAEDPYGIGLPKGSDAAAFVNAWLKTIEEDGTWAKLWQVSIGERTGQSESPEPPAIKE